MLITWFKISDLAHSLSSHFIFLRDDWQYFRQGLHLCKILKAQETTLEIREDSGSYTREDGDNWSEIGQCHQGGREGKVGQRHGSESLTVFSCMIS